MKHKTKEQISVTHQFIEKIIGKGDLSYYDQLVAENASGHCPDSWEEIHPSHAHGKRDINKINLKYSEAFQLIAIDIQEIAPFKDKVFAKWSCEKIHKNDFYGIEGTNRRILISGQTVFSFQEEGKIKEVWQSWDMFGLLRQIGWKPKTIILEGDEFDSILKKASSLTEREKACLNLLVKGNTSRETAAVLFISPRTVEYYFENIKNKLACSNKKEVFSIARVLESNGCL